MNRTKVRTILSKHTSGGNAFLLFDYLLDKKEVEINISQEELAKELSKSRPSINASLSLLKEENLIEFSYGKIKILGTKNEK